jgi:hypothetical protein
LHADNGRGKGGGGKGAAGYLEVITPGRIPVNNYGFAAKCSEFSVLIKQLSRPDDDGRENREKNRERGGGKRKIKRDL